MNCPQFVVQTNVGFSTQGYDSVHWSIADFGGPCAHSSPSPPHFLKLRSVPSFLSQIISVSSSFVPLLSPVPFPNCSAIIGLVTSRLWVDIRPFYIFTCCRVWRACILKSLKNERWRSPTDFSLDCAQYHRLRVQEDSEGSVMSLAVGIKLLHHQFQNEYAMQVKLRLSQFVVPGTE